MNANDCFTLGSTVAVKTMHDDFIEGQVMAFDLATKLLILSESRFIKILQAPAIDPALFNQLLANDDTNNNFSSF
jgi:hypothetical protein